jgi:hypothetical protein
MKKKITLILVLALGAFCLWMFDLSEAQQKSKFECLPAKGENYAAESPEIAKNLSQDDIVIIVEYIRDRIMGTGVGDINKNQSTDANNKIFSSYFGYISQTYDYQKAWGLRSGSIFEITPEEFLRAFHSGSSPDLPRNVYSIHFYKIQSGTLCVAVENRYYRGLREGAGRGGNISMWSLRKSFFGKWEYTREIVSRNYD